MMRYLGCGAEVSTMHQRFHPLWQLRKLQAFRWFQEKFDVDIPCRIAGLFVWVRVLRDASFVFTSRTLEHETRGEFSRIVRDERIELFFDIGANLGLYSWLARANGVGEVFLVEADRQNQRLLAKTIRTNRLECFFLVPFAMSDRTGTARFLIDRASGASGGLAESGQDLVAMHRAYGMGESCIVPTLPLDVFGPYAAGKRTMLKIDVEGGEALVIKGGMDFIRDVLPWILIECFERSRLEPFEKLGYAIRGMTENRNYLLSPPVRRGGA